MTTAIQNEQIECSVCKRALLFDIAILQDEQYYCPDCYKQSFFECECCGGVFEIADRKETPDNGEPFCQDCIDELYFTCNQCNELTHGDSTATVNGDIVCQACLDADCFCCENCNDYFYNAERNAGSDDYYYCDECFSDLFTNCNGCGETILIEYAYFHDDYYYCEACLPSEREDGLYNYSYTPDYHFYGDSKDDLYFGIELEIENEQTDDYLSDINDTGHSSLYAKHDGSLDQGLEVVSHPFTFEYFNNAFDKVWKPILDCKEHGYRSYNTNTCGIHIHISKKAFSTLHLYKFMKFFYKNNDFIEFISQRRKEKLEEWADNSKTGSNMVKKAKHKTGNNARYSAINLQPYATVEIRIFRGTLDVQSFRKNLEFLHALYGFTKKYGISGMIKTKFIEYVHKNKKQYKNLQAFLDGKKVDISNS
jgi:formylmethanofuran dehydrogenase subunit E